MFNNPTRILLLKIKALRKAILQKMYKKVSPTPSPWYLIKWLSGNNLLCYNLKGSISKVVTMKRPLRKFGKETNMFRKSDWNLYSLKEKFYDGQGCLRNPGESYFDGEGIIRETWEEYFDYQGIFRKSDEEFYDSQGFLRQPDESFYDSLGNLCEK